MTSQNIYYDLLGTAAEERRSGNEFRAIELEKYLTLLSTMKGYEEFLLNDDGVVISSNLEAVNITGYEEFEIIGKHISVFYPADQQSQADEDLRKSRQSKQIVVTGIRLKKRGTAFWAKMKIRHLTDGRAAYRVTVQDNTHRTLSTFRIQSLRDEFLTIFNNPFIGTFKYRMSDRRVLMCNQKVMEITGYSVSDNLFIQTWFSSASQFQQFEEILERDKKVEGFQFLINDRRTSTENWGLISARYFENKGVVGGVIMDISEQYHQMSELQRVNAELESFTYHASHDLRAPLTTILGLTNLGIKEENIENARGFFEMIRSRIHHLDTLLKDLVSISYNVKVEVNAEEFDFDRELSEILETLQGPFSNVMIDCSVDQPRGFVTDGKRMRIILRNLLSNALKYHNPENAPPFVRVRIRVTPTHASIKVQDNGIGIDFESKQRIFDMFVRATTRSTGSGLGLYIVRSMLEKLGGKIVVESTFTKGTTFLLTVPNMATTTN